MTGTQPNPLHGLTLEQILVSLVGHYGWDELGGGSRSAASAATRASNPA